VALLAGLAAAHILVLAAHVADPSRHAHLLKATVWPWELVLFFGDLASIAPINVLRVANQWGRVQPRGDRISLFLPPVERRSFLYYGTNVRACLPGLVVLRHPNPYRRQRRFVCEGSSTFGAPIATIKGGGRMSAGATAAYLLPMSIALRPMAALSAPVQSREPEPHGRT
jgi:hypothetical protein